MFDLDELDFDDLALSHKDMDNQLLQNFGINYLEDAIRIIQTGMFTPMDSEVINEAMCIVMSIYVRKINAGEINKDVVFH